MKNCLLLAAALLSSCSLLGQTTIYVDPSIPHNSSAAGTAADPYGSISAACDAVHAGGGGDVLIPNGTYELTTPVDITTPATASTAVTIKPVTGETVKFNFGVRSAFHFEEGSSHITLEGFEIDGNTDETDFWCIVAEDFWSVAGNPAGGGLAVILDGEYITIKDNYIHDCYQKAVEIRSGRYVVVDGNIIKSIANTSLSGGHGIMRQQTGKEFFTDDLANVYRWDIRNNFIFNVEQRIYSWVPSKGFIEMVIDEGKSILIDDPKDTDGNQERMSARIYNNVIAFGAVDHIRLKSTPNLEVSNNSIYSEGLSGDGITDKGGDTNTPKFTNFICRNNASHTMENISAIEIDKCVEETLAAGGTPIVSNNHAVRGRIKPPGQAGITRYASGQLFVNPNSGNFTINPALNLPAGVGVTPAVLTELGQRANAFGVTIGWDGWITDNLKLSQTILDNIPGINDGIVGNETVLTDAGVMSVDHTHIDFNVVNGTWKTERRSTDTQRFELNPFYEAWYADIATNHLNAAGAEYERIRYGDSYVKQNQVFDEDWLLVSEIQSNSNTLIQGYDNSFSLDGDLLVKFENFTPSIGDSWDLITAGTITGTNTPDLFDRVLFEGFTPGNYTLEVVNLGTGGQALRLTIVAAALPVELSKFTASALTAKTARLNWETLSERANDFFSIERSTNGRDWAEIGKVSGKGDSRVATNYDFIDRNPLNGLNYYRLRQVDFSGRFEHSTVEILNFSIEEFSAFPNPASDIIYLNGVQTGEVVRLLDIQGRNVTGNRFSGQNQTSQLDVKGLPAGVYYLSVGNQVLKVTVQ